MKSKKYLPIIAFFFCITFLFTSCNNYVNKSTLYNFGIEVTKSMGEFVKEKFIQENHENVDFNKFIAYDYDTPIKLYKLNIPTFENWLQSPKLENFYKEEYNNFSDILKEQFKIQTDERTKINQSLFEHSNFYDYQFITYCYLIKNFNGIISQTTCYLYIFETGVPIIIIFEQINEKIKATGIFAPIEKLKTLSGIREVFESYNFTIETIEIK